MSSKAKEMEDEIARYWAKDKIYEKVKAHRSEGKKWYWLDGPPYATGSIHVGTAMNKVIKDFWLRYYRMLGFNAWAQPGYDTHGVPIENKVEKLLNFKAKDDIENYGVENFIKKCKEFATEYVGVMGEQFINLGVWMDWDNPYLTLHNSYIEGAWYTFKKAFEKGLLYRGDYSVHVCPHCETAVAYNEIEYNTVTDTSIYVKFKVKGVPNEWLVIWTTTPWTIPSNTGVMANPKADYVKVEAGDQVLIVGKELHESLMEKFGFGADTYKIIKELKGKDLEGLKYEHPLKDTFKFLQGLENAHRVVMSDQFVILDEGTGLVHTAPGHGQEDYKVGKEQGLPLINPLKMNGRFNELSGKYAGIFAKEADKMIIEDLQERGVLMATEKLKHEYPLCWRDGSPLLMMAVPQWFFRVTEIRDKLIEENESVNWIPSWAGSRFKNWLESLGDWPISRQRYWGIPLPIWICDSCNDIQVIGSKKELPEVPKDFHKPYIDKIKLKCKKCGGQMTRVPDVLDVWFDSGVAAWASMGYPGSDQPFKEWWPVDFVLEGPDQIRGWWNSCMITSVMTFGRKAFDNVLFHGFVLDAHGNKMSKSKGNIVSTEDAIEKYGRDVLRFYYLSRPVWDDMYFSVSDLEELAKSFMVVRNTFKFVDTYVIDSPIEKPEKLNIEDQWIISRMNSIIDSATQNLGNFVSHKPANEILDFILNDFSRWYIKIIRDRVWPEYQGDDKKAAFYTLVIVTENIARLIAPYCPFLAENVYQEVLKGRLAETSSLASIHMTDWPIVDESSMDKELESAMSIAKQIVEASHATRQSAGIKLRWPVANVYIISDNEKVASSVKLLQEVLRSMCNSKKVSVVKKSPEGDFSVVETAIGNVCVDTVLTEELEREAMFRELVRVIQGMRKKAGLNIKDRIELTLKSDSNDIDKFLKKMSNALKKEVGASAVKVGEVDGSHTGTLSFKEHGITLAFDTT